MTFLDHLPKPFFILAPMDDVTDTVFRQVISNLVPPDLYLTEFVNVDGLQSPGRERLLHKLRFSQKERPIVAQLWGLKPENFYKTVKELVDGTLVAEANALQGRDRLESRGASLDLNSELVKSTDQRALKRSEFLGFAGVDINMGCPVKTVIKNGACAALINNRQLAGEIIDATREAAGKHFPVSVKTRVGFTTPDLTWPEFLLTKKLDLLSIHGRTAKELSNVPADWNLIGQVRQIRDTTCPSTKIVGNGDIMSRQQGLVLANKYKLDGVMIGRGLFHDPFAFAKNSPWGSYSRQQKLDLYRQHVELFAKTWQNGERRIETLNKFCKVYINGFDGAKELREQLMQAKTTQELLSLL